MKRTNASVGTYITMMKHFSCLGSWLIAWALLLGTAQAFGQAPAAPTHTARPDSRSTARDELREAKREARDAERAVREAERRAEEAERRLEVAQDRDDDEDDNDDDDESEAPQLTIGDDQKQPQRVSLGNDVHIPPGAVVGSAVAVGGSVFVGDGAVVHDDVVAMGGNIEVGEHVVVEGDLVSVGGTITVAPTAVIKGNRVNAGLQLPTMSRVFKTTALPWSSIGVVASIIRSLMLFALATLAVMLMPRRITVMRSFLAQRTGSSALAGFAALAAIIPLCVLLVVTLVGIPLVPVAVACFLLAMVVGFTVVAVAIGEKLPVLQHRKTMFLSLVLGFVVLTVINLVVPWIGTALVLATSLVGMGAVFLSRLGQTQGLPPQPPPTSTALTTNPENRR